MIRLYAFAILMISGCMAASRSDSIHYSDLKPNALWNDSGKNRNLAFWLYSTTGSCPSIRKNDPIVFASKSDLAGATAKEVSVTDLKYCFELFPKGSRIGGDNYCKSGNVSYTYVSDQKMYFGTYKFKFSDESVLEGKFLAEYCPAEDQK